MTIKPVAQTEEQCGEDHWNDYSCQDRVGDENREVHSPRPSVAPEVNRANMGVVVEVAAKKGRGGDKGRDHRGPMSKHLSALDEVMSYAEKYCSDAVQRGIEGWEDSVINLQVLPWELPTRRSQ